jgi:formate hydrogenlyase subunit 6/NADH:ubiquinone oxidoreductase subunit I
MPFWFVRGLRRGVVTTRYPARPDGSGAFLPTPPAFRPRELTRETADRIVAACPSLALSRLADELVFDIGACTACGRCAAAAPHAVTSSREWELATTARSALVKIIPILGEQR